MIDVFISYSRADKPAARNLAESVKRLGYSVWWDEKLPAHLSHEEAIVEARDASPKTRPTADQPEARHRRADHRRRC